ncbi:fumarylacetoacetate hydrolase family protein [Paenibacillus sp. LHD-117]|uniref:fumarylacetoacetate hydrolase family protein n=1 Tax=Paenibacillus sp. LHD-117 TaxID=3071412 RepID=UPI0027DFFC4C|nr:fumarylacetoacetate hydrolase family protein [Paenibacillus sp. LHD-117]MDQ6423164.1 fumarylacetoacetate hydrolase family protein [Paenibacillus sp. LHD-117]
MSTIGVEPKEIKNIYCIGRNYKLHALELGNEVPESPLVFMKPSHSVAGMDGGTVELPGSAGEVHFELEIVLRIGEGYKPGAPADDCIDAMTLGLDLTLRDVQSKLKAKGQPWLEAKGFKASAPLGRLMAYPGEAALAEQEFTLLRGEEVAQRGCAKDMIFGVSELVRHIEANYGLGAGDLIFTGTPAGVAALREGDKLQAFWGEEKLGECTVTLNQ